MFRRLVKSKYDIITEVMCLLMLVGQAVYLCVMWGRIPDKIPSHFNAVGEIDAWGNKIEIIIMSILALVVYVTITLVSMFPRIWNTGVEVTEENRVGVYQALKNMLNTVKLIIIADFSYIFINMVLGEPLNAWFTPIFLISLFGTIIFFSTKLSRMAKR